MSKRSSSDPSGPVHQPVLLREVLQFLDLQPNLIVVDGTVGAGGHSLRIVPEISPGGSLLGLDRDPMMLRLAEQRLAGSDGVRLIHSSYARLRDQLDAIDVDAVDRVLVDLGLSSDQLEDRTRGFGFRAGGTLDLRFDPSTGVPASELLRTSGEQELRTIFEEFGDERFAGQIAKAIARSRSVISTTEELEQIVSAAVPGSGRGGKHPATRVMQALRIAVNDELQHLQRSLDVTFHQCIRPGGRLVVISFHSIEDRMVKQAFRRQDQWQSLTPKPVEASPAELRMNPRARSAKLRAAIRK